jgi:peptidoglycan DL-endopeptidase CwlO
MNGLGDAPKLAIGAIALSFIAAGCASTGARPRPFPVPSARSTPQPDKPEPTEPALPPTGRPTASEPAAGADGIVRTALGLQGVPYRNGGQAFDGFDCSGFTQFVFGAHGVFLPREVIEQFKVGRSVALDEIAPGDLIFFATAGRRPSHVAIAIDGDSFVHAPSSNGVVRVEPLASSYWAPRLVGIRRVNTN